MAVASISTRIVSTPWRPPDASRAVHLHWHPKAGRVGWLVSEWDFKHRLGFSKRWEFLSDMIWLRNDGWLIIASGCCGLWTYLVYLWGIWSPIMGIRRVSSTAHMDFELLNWRVVFYCTCNCSCSSIAPEWLSYSNWLWRRVETSELTCTSNKQTFNIL